MDGRLLDMWNPHTHTSTHRNDQAFPRSPDTNPTEENLPEIVQVPMYSSLQTRRLIIDLCWTIGGWRSAATRVTCSISCHGQYGAGELILLLIWYQLTRKAVAKKTKGEGQVTDCAWGGEVDE